MPSSPQLLETCLEDAGVRSFANVPRSRHAAFRFLQLCTQAAGNIAILVGTSTGLTLAALTFLADPSAPQREAHMMTAVVGLRGSLAEHGTALVKSR